MKTETGLRTPSKTNTNKRDRRVRFREPSWAMSVGFVTLIRYD